MAPDKSLELHIGGLDMYSILKLLFWPYRDVCTKRREQEAILQQTGTETDSHSILNFWEEFTTCLKSSGAKRLDK